MNQKLLSLINSQQPFSAIRFGFTEAGALISLSQGETCADGVKYWLEYGAGVWPTDDEFLLSSFYLANLHAYRAADIVGFVGTDHAELFSLLLGRKEYIWSRGGKVFLDPVYLLGKCWAIPSSPWTAALRAKNVLVISPFKKSIEHQWEHRFKIWGSDCELLTPYNLVGVVVPPHPPVIAGNEYSWRGRQYDNWLDAAFTILEELTSIDFDIAFIGAGALSPILATGIKSLGKGAVTLNSTTQLHFGISGRRWNEHQPDVLNPFFNEYWLSRPFEADIPKFAHLTPERAYY
jgi:hypothetical protein